MQSRYGSRKAYLKFDLAEDRLSEIEIEFLAERDSFYMARLVQ